MKTAIQLLDVPWHHFAEIARRHGRGPQLVALVENVARALPPNVTQDQYYALIEQEADRIGNGPFQRKAADTYLRKYYIGGKLPEAKR